MSKESLREFAVEAMGQDGWIYKVHVFGEDGGIAWRMAEQKIDAAMRGSCGPLQMFSLVEGRMTSLGWRVLS